MKITTGIIPLFFAFFLSLSFQGLGQDLPPTAIGDSIKIKTFDGNIFSGVVFDQDDKLIVLKTSFADGIDIEKKTIEQLLNLSLNQDDPLYLAEFKEIEDNSWRPNLNPSYMVVTPTGFNPRKGQGYYQNTQLFYNSIGYGFTDNFSLNFGFSLTNFFTSGSSSNFYLVTPKFTHQINDYISLGISTTVGVVPDVDGFAVLNGVCTFGHRDSRYFSVGLMYGIPNDELGDSPVFTFSGYFQLSQKIAFITENWGIPWNNDEGFVSFLSSGIRYLGKTISFDLLLVSKSNLDIDGVVGIPVLGMVIPFNKKG